MVSRYSSDTIVAPATPSGRGGVAVIRISGSKTQSIAQAILKQTLKPRYAYHRPFYGSDDEVLDEGIALYFSAPHSFTGEDVVELQGHGGSIVVDRLLKRVISLGARLATPGEFSYRAFINDKIDLTQAEAIADLINASSEQAARSAIKSLQGEFSNRIQRLLEALIQLRIFVEAAIDFPEEEVDFLSDSRVSSNLEKIIHDLSALKRCAKQGRLLQEGMTVVIAGAPNVGKSSLLNCLSQKQSAIVTDIAGTTRDVLREIIHIDGLPLHIVDTAGLRDSDDAVEQEGIRRAKHAMTEADEILWMIEGDNRSLVNWSLFPNDKPITIIHNKIDLYSEVARVEKDSKLKCTNIYLSAKTGAGIDLLKQHLKDVVGFDQSEGIFIARRRHLEALQQAQQHLYQGQQQLQKYQAGELLAEELRQAQQALSEITGEFSSDDLLGRIFSSFCIGK